uniref:Uncharacterized protein n=1 Tax=Leersia perrieri TaxID=77586 RepID=A0A0D9WNV7_9ORYZ
MAMMVRSKLVVPMLMLSVILLGSSWPVAAARPLQKSDGGDVVVPTAAGVGNILVLPSSLWRLRHWLPVLEMKQHASCSTWDPNNVNCPPKPGN